jgi:deoxyribodipyrimidine photo-lyase
LNKKKINIVWFKRDLRFVDHEPLLLAQKEELPVLLVYLFEPSVMSFDDSDDRHWRFIYESISAMQLKLAEVSSQLYYFHNEVATVFEELTKVYDINTVFSHQEIGNKITYDRDIAMHRFFQENDIPWKEVIIGSLLYCLCYIPGIIYCIKWMKREF